MLGSPSDLLAHSAILLKVNKVKPLHFICAKAAGVNLSTPPVFARREHVKSGRVRVSDIVLTDSKDPFGLQVVFWRRKAKARTQVAASIRHIFGYIWFIWLSSLSATLLHLLSKAVESFPPVVCE